MPDGTDNRAAFTRKPQQRRDAKHMTRETKISILFGVSLVLMIAILISDHFSTASNAQLAATDSDPASIQPQQAGDSYAMNTPSVIVQDESGRFIPLDQINASNEHAEPEQSTLGQLAASLQNEYDHLRDTGLYPAAEIDTVPSLRMGEPANQPETAQPQASDHQTRPERSHTVAEGDTLWGIASMYYSSGLLHTDLRTYNGLTSTAGLTIGMEIRIPERSTLSSPAPAQAAPRQTANPSTRHQTAQGFDLYTVQSGDTLSQIAQRELGTVSRMDDIQDAQGRSIDPEDFMLRVGMTLRLPSN
jgi:nucleoid-associated protein YgaU